MIKGLLFDLDGTLVDTHIANYEAYRDALSDIGLDITYEDFKKSIGHQARTFLPWFAPGQTENVYAKISARKAVYYQRKMHRTRLNVKLKQFLEAMKPNHVIVLVTTAKRENAFAVLRHHNLEKMFDIIICAEDVKMSKPNPECYVKALNKAKLLPTEVIAFEDSEPGIVAAQAAGISGVVKVGEFS